jgi:hypothetical protein
LLLLNVTTTPIGGAAPFSVTVPVDPAPPITVLGFSESDVNEATVTVRLVVLVTPNTPEIVTVV